MSIFANLLMSIGYVSIISIKRIFNPGPQDIGLLLHFRTPDKDLGVSAVRMPEEEDSCKLLPFPQVPLTLKASDYLPAHSLHRKLPSAHSKAKTEVRIIAGERDSKTKLGTLRNFY